MRSETVFQILFTVAPLFIGLAKTEYIWSGSEWVWKEKEVSVPETNNGYEGSGSSTTYYGGRDNNKDSYTYDDDDEYDDEVEGSGDEDQDTGGIYKSNNFDRNEDHDRVVENNYNENVYWEQTSSTYTPPIADFDDNKIDIDGPMPAVPTTTTTTTTTAPPNLFDPVEPSITPNTNSRSTSFFAQPGTLAAVVGGAVVGLLCAILCVMFVVYRMRKKDEGSYALDEPKRSSALNSYAKPPNREFFA